MAESILVTGKKISSMELVTNVTGNEKIPTGQPDDLAVTPNQIADHTIARGDLASQEDLSQVEVSLGTQVEDLVRDLAAEEAARIAADNLKVDKDGSVSSVAGRVGDVVLAPSDVLVEGFGSQEDVNKYVAKPFLSGYTYGLGERVVLDGGEVVKSAIEGNFSDPNVGMTGWVSTVSDSLSGTIQTFTTPEAGVDPVTGVVDGNYFNVRSSSDESYVYEYQNVGGVPTLTGKSYPSGAALNAVKEAIIDPETGTAMASKIFTSSGENQEEVNESLFQEIDFVNDQFLLIERFINNGSNYIDDALDEIKAELLTKGAMSGGTLMLPRGIWRISRSHDLSVTGLRLCGDGGRYASRLVADADGDYSAGYVLKIAPTSGQVISGGSGLEKVTIDLNEAPAIGLIYQGAYDVSAFDRAEVINGHKDYPCAVIEPHPNGTVIQTLKIDTSGFSKKSVGGTGYVVEIRMAQECIIINSKMFGSPSNQATKGSVPLLLENVRGVQIIGGGLANSETNCIHIYAKARNTTHVTIVGPTFEGYKAKAIKTFAESGFTVSRLVTMNERMITPSAGLLEGGSLTFSTIYACNADIELLAGSTNNVIHTFDKSKVIDNGTYNEVIETPSSLNGNTHVSSRSQAAVLVTTPQFILGVVGRTGNYAFRWDASATVDSGVSFMTPNGSKPIRLFDDRLGFFEASPVVQRTSPAASLTDTQKIDAIVLGLEQLGLFKPAT